ncbi:hypothetical protein B0H19DRAFT_1082278 [Mycena capillaripes]|nr:hypothetical protein B0H19DRAFT_1082278 [Mycena capillaripes]
MKQVKSESVASGGTSYHERAPDLLVPALNRERERQHFGSAAAELCGGGYKGSAYDLYGELDINQSGADPVQISRIELYKLHGFVWTSAEAKLRRSLNAAILCQRLGVVFSFLFFTSGSVVGKISTAARLQSRDFEPTKFGVVAACGRRGASWSGRGASTEEGRLDGCGAPIVSE